LSAQIVGLPLVDAEVALETAISVARASMLECQRAGDMSGARNAQDELVELCAQRRPQMVEHMERRKGLRK
jgi:hypothetical protein